ncbi:hypothetical protein HNQ51_002172 [Inhella inkyongensis]|uniref:Uncharacterized protein n=1 Tax=Inhella inkyongensis TaxID=392593 RepID=A0A840S5T5_9BURK|nr:hypothetical protein [Inhella inkyongensis]MBB5204858.1 hypothetical protein [Inhella inkyongensis]
MSLNPFVSPLQPRAVSWQVLALAGLCLAASAHAQPEAGERRQGPPPQALAACKSLSSGQACSFQRPNGSSVSGTCFAPRSELALACRPSSSERPAPGASAPGMPGKSAR